MVSPKRTALFVVLAALLLLPGLAAASKELRGGTLAFSLDPDDPFFIDGETVRIVVSLNATTSISGDLGIGIALPPALSQGACPATGDAQLVFLDFGTGDGSQCLATWFANPAGRITQFDGVSLPAGFQTSAELLRFTVNPGLPRGVFVFFGYILDSANPAVIRDAATTTLDLE